MAYEYTVSESEAAHYNEIRITRGWTWETLAAYFDQQETDPSAPFLAAWARSQRDEPVPTAKRARKGTSRAVSGAPEKR